MKKHVVCGIVLYCLGGCLICDNAIAESYSLTDFLFGRKKTTETQFDEVHERINQELEKKHQTEDEQDEDVTEISEENKIETPQLEINNVDVSQDTKTNEKEIFISPSLKVNSIEELMETITKNIKCIENGKISESDRSNLQKEKEMIARNIEQYKKARLIYDKVHLLELILTSYNIINEIPVRFLSDIAKDDVSKVQIALLADSLKANRENLANDFKIALSERDNNKISELAKIDVSQNLNTFATSLLEKAKTIPTELLDNNSGKRIEEAVKIFSMQIDGNFAEKHGIMLNMFNAYNSLKEISFRLCKIDNEVIKNLAIKITEDLFAKIENDLKIMKKSNYSVNADEDEIALAARNIQKLEVMLFGGQMASGTALESRIERFQKTEATEGKKEILEEVITQFNKAAKYYDGAAQLIKSKNGNVSKHGLEQINLISEDLDKIFAKIGEYDKPYATSRNNFESQESGNAAHIESGQEEKLNKEVAPTSMSKEIAAISQTNEYAQKTEPSEIQNDSINIEELENTEDEEAENTERELAEVAESLKSEE